ncbi:MAG TPA: hypothetical protein VKY36_03735 [Moheibacter sp.]|nr:hypothetical protein [Moheibacter sp.]
MKILTPILFLSFLFLNVSCFEDLFGIEEDGDEYYYEDDQGSLNTNPGYDFTYECPGGYGDPFTVPIPEGTTECQQAYEYYAEIYGCNMYEYFNDANCTLCAACNLDNYCAICE